MVMAAGASDPAKDAEAQAALSQLCHDYWPPLYSFVRRRGYSPADSQDLVQGFFVHILEHRTYALADPAKGNFRAFLLSSLKNFLSDERRHERRQKRGGDLHFVPLDEEVAAVEAAYAREPIAMMQLDEEQVFERRWAATLAASALHRLKEKYPSGPKLRVFNALTPYLTGDEAALRTAHGEVAAQLGVPVDTLRSYLLRLRKHYRELLRAEVIRTVAKAENVEEELRHLHRVLAAGAIQD
jgi:RNA polymerase sigma factor (sigma-70 family)